MARHIHIHLHDTTNDAWEESKHPRASNGEFGSGKGGEKGKGGAHAPGGKAKFNERVAILKKELAIDMKEAGSEAEIARLHVKFDEDVRALSHIYMSEGARKAHPESFIEMPSHEVKQAGRKYTATAEKSQFGGYTAHIINEDGSTAYSSQWAFEKPEQAAEYARRYAEAPMALSHGVRAPRPELFPGFIKK